MPYPVAYRLLRAVIFRPHCQRVLHPLLGPGLIAGCQNTPRRANKDPICARTLGQIRSTLLIWCGIVSGAVGVP
jgi:hypothetical protein